MPLEMSMEDVRLCQSRLIRDPTPGPRGPITVARSFFEGLRRIDPRLELRWLPRIGKYGVFIRLEASKALWPVAVHVVEDSQGGFRAPGDPDLAAIRKAKYMMETVGYRAWVDAMDRIVASQEREEKERIDRLAREVAVDYCRRYDLTRESFGVTSRKPVMPSKRTEKTYTWIRNSARN